MPRNRPAAAAEPQPARVATASSTASSLGRFANSLRRNRYGSMPAACAISSMKLSLKNAFCEWLTLRHTPTGTCVFRIAKSTA